MLQGICRCVDVSKGTVYRFKRTEKTGTTSYNPLGIDILNVWWLLFVQWIYMYMCTVVGNSFKGNCLGVFARIGTLLPSHTYYLSNPCKNP